MPLLPPPAVHPLDNYAIHRPADFEANLSGDLSQYTITRKYDGIRCIAVRDASGVTRYFTRECHEIIGLELPLPGHQPGIFDGELYHATEAGPAAVMQAIHRSNSEALRLALFPTPQLNASDVLRFIQEPGCAHLAYQFRYGQPLSQHLLTCSASRWEGLVLWRHGRPVWKVKRWRDMEGRIVEPLIHDGQLLGCMVDIEGTLIDVTAGFSQRQRTELARDPQALIGQLMTVAFEPGSLRNPRCVILHGKERIA